MTPQELRLSILQLAIQGKLVPQIPEEGTGEELLRQIQSEKQALIKAGKIKSEKPLAAISDDEVPYDIPENWMWVKLGELCSIFTGKKDANFGSDTGKYYFFTCAKDPIRCDSFSFSGEAILMAGNGDIGNLSYYYGNFEAYQRTYVLQPYIEFSYLKYILCHLMCNWVSYNNDKTFGTAIPYIRLGNVQNYLVALPPLAEQKRIVAKIEELLPLIDRYEQAWSKLEDFNKCFPVDMQKSILQMAIQGKLVLQLSEEGTGEELYQQIQAEKQALIKAEKIKKEKPLPEITDDEISFEIPESWKLVHLDDVVIKSIKRGKSPTYIIKSNTLVFSQKCNTKAGYIDLSLSQYLDESKLSKYPDEEFMRDCDIVINSTGNGTLGRVGIYHNSDNPGKLQVVPDSHVTVIRTSEVICVEYVYYVLKHYQPFLEKLGTGTTNQTELSAGVVRALPFPLPPLGEQKRIVAKLEEILPLCERLK